MEWYYGLTDGRRQGPVSQDELLSLLSSQAIHPGTLVWRQGLPDWIQFSESGLVAPETPATATQPGGSAVGRFRTCDECGLARPESDLLPVGGATVCVACKDHAVEKLRGGIPVGRGRWRDGNRLVARDGHVLTDFCICCGGAPTGKPMKRVYQWHPPLIYIVLLISPLIYIIVALIVRRRLTLHLSACQPCRKRRRMKLAVGWLVFFGSIAVAVLGGAHDRGWMIASGLLAWIVSCFWLALAARLLVPARIENQFGWFKRAPQSVVATLPEWRG